MPRFPVCIDASIVVALVTPEVQSEKALALWGEWMRAGVEVIAPTLLRGEVASALWRKVVRNVMGLEDARRCLQEALSLDIEFLDPPELPLRAFDLAARFRRPAARPLPSPGRADEGGVLDGRRAVMQRRPEGVPPYPLARGLQVIGKPRPVSWAQCIPGSFAYFCWACLW